MCACPWSRRTRWRCTPGSCGRSRPSRRGTSWRQRRAWPCSTIPPRASSRRRRMWWAPTRPGSGGSVSRPTIRTRSRCSCAGTTCARAPRSTRCRSRSCSRPTDAEGDRFETCVDAGIDAGREPLATLSIARLSPRRDICALTHSTRKLLRIRVIQQTLPETSAKLSSDIGTIGVGHSLRPRTVQPLHVTSSEANRFRSEACSFRGLSGSRRGRR
ncbi:hypothetical protein FRAHR75_750003 [Frankia sp. Hr75.2]|nr:hypothetical protein FRAHR75_750003 [Frankia sp. Hr75.2]